MTEQQTAIALLICTILGGVAGITGVFIGMFITGVI